MMIRTKLLQTGLLVIGDTYLLVACSAIQKEKKKKEREEAVLITVTTTVIT